MRERARARGGYVDSSRANRVEGATTSAKRTVTMVGERREGSRIAKTPCQEARRSVGEVQRGSTFENPATTAQTQKAAKRSYRRRNE